MFYFCLMIGYLDPNLHILYVMTGCAFDVQRGGIDDLAWFDVFRLGSNKIHQILLFCEGKVGKEAKVKLLRQSTSLF